jgi:hypothetical protein
VKSRLISSGRIKVNHLRHQKPLGPELRSQYLLDDRLDDHTLHYCYFPETENGEGEYEEEMGGSQREAG